MALVEEAFASARISPGQARDYLAQLEAQLEQIQCKGIDAVPTVGISEELATATRVLRRDLTRQVEKLQSRLDATFDSIRSMLAPVK